MMGNLFNMIVIATLVGTFVLAPVPRPSPPSVTPQLAETAAASPGIDRAVAGSWRAEAYVGTAEIQLTVDPAGRVLPD